MKPFSSILCALLCATGVAFAASPTSVSLLSVSTAEATLDVATPESRRPVFVPEPEPYSAADLEKLSGLPLARAMAANDRARKANEKAKAVFEQKDRDRRKKSEDEALHEFSLTELGTAVAKAPGFFREEAASAEGLSVLRIGEDGYFVAPKDARLVRLFFDPPRKSAGAEAIPGISTVPVSLSISVTMKIESADGDTLRTETFGQTQSYSNSDKLLGPAYAEAVEGIVRSAVKEAVARVSEDAPRQ